MESPTTRTLKYLRDRGWIVRKVEHWNQFARKRMDLFGGDILAIHPKIRYPMLVQCTTTAHLTDRQKKVAEIPEVKIWLRVGAFMCIGWSKPVKTNRWTYTARYGFYDEKSGQLQWIEPAE